MNTSLQNKKCSRFDRNNWKRIQNSITTETAEKQQLSEWVYMWNLNMCQRVVH